MKLEDKPDPIDASAQYKGSHIVLRPSSNVGQSDPYPSLSTPPVLLGEYSSPAFPDGMYFAKNFLLGAGMLILQPATGKVVVIEDTKSHEWILPKGRKDVGESLEAAAVREASEEPGFTPKLMDLCTPTQAPRVNGSNVETDPGAVADIGQVFNKEPIYVSTLYWPVTQRRVQAGIYFTFWYVGEIPEDAVPREGTRMTNEQHYVTHLLEYDDACTRLSTSDPYFYVLKLGYALWKQMIASRLSPT